MSHNLLDSDAQALVNTVNCVGVMGKGLALQFKKRFPEMFEEYRARCAEGLIHIGSMHVWPIPDSTRYVINFPTKGHWRAESRIWFIRHGLDELRRTLRDYEIGSVAIPPLGCGLGGLDWKEVEPLIYAKLSDLECVVTVYPPGRAGPYRLSCSEEPPVLMNVFVETTARP